MYVVNNEDYRITEIHEFLSFILVKIVIFSSEIRLSAGCLAACKSSMQNVMEGMGKKYARAGAGLRRENRNMHTRVSPGA